MTSVVPITPVIASAARHSIHQEVAVVRIDPNHQMSATEISDAHIKLINYSWDYHPDPEHTMASISESKVQAFADAIKVNAPFSVALEKFALIKQDRPTEVETLLGDPTKAKQRLGWVPEITAQEMCKEMVANDLAQAKRHALLRRHGYQIAASVE